MRMTAWMSVLIAAPLALAGCGGSEGALEGGASGEETGSAISPGSALVTFSICGQRLTVSSTSAPFIQEAQQQLQGGKVRIPVFDLLDGRGVDPQWTWHVNPATTIFADGAIELCDGCPAAVEKDKAYWIHRVKRYCPWSAKVVRVVK